MQDELFFYKQGVAILIPLGEDPCLLVCVKGDYDVTKCSGNLIPAANMIRLSSIFDAAKSESCKHDVGHLIAKHYKMIFFSFLNLSFV